MIRFRVLGGVELCDAASRPLNGILTQPKRLALLAYLCVARPRGFHRRDTLLGLFWPELSDERARGALNQSVYHLRRALGRDVVVSRGPGEVGIDPGRIWCDAVAFEEALTDGSLIDALDLYRGDLLIGFFLAETAEWERWLEDERARLRARAAAGAWTLAEEAAGGHDAAEAAWWARRSAALSPGDEPRLRQLMSLLDRLGDRVGALRAYEEAVGQWARDADIEPSPDTRELVERIRAGDAQARPVPPPAPIAADDSPRPTPDLALPGSDAPVTTLRGLRRLHRLHRPARLAAAAILLAMLVASAALFRAGADAPLPPDVTFAGGTTPTRSEAARPRTVTPADAPSDQGDAAYAEYVRGRHLLTKLEAASFVAARAHFENAVDADPTFASAWGGLAESFILLTNMMVLPAAEAYPRARAAAERALALDPDVAEAHAALATAMAMYYWDTAAAELHFRHAVRLGPESAHIRRMYAAHLRNLGRFQEALAQIRTAQVLDPLFAFAHVEEAITLYAARRHDEALRKLQQYTLVNPGDTHAYVFVAMVLAELGRYDEALAALRRTDPQRQRPDAQAISGVVYARMGRPDDARLMLDVLDALGAAGRPVSPFHKAVVHTALGDVQTALDLLELAAGQPTWQLRLLKVTPVWDSLRDEPRFRDLLVRVGLES